MRVSLASSQRWIAPLLLLVVAAITYGTRYWQPQSLFWDENYHVASAQKHLDGVMYMEPHPPLGKQLIALGEWLVGDNAERDTSALLIRDHVSGAQLPAGYSFRGVRLPSVLLSIASVLLAYAMLLRITGLRGLALGFALLLALDNALVVHARAAMLEGIQLFFVMLSLWLFTLSVTRGTAIRLRDYLRLGTGIGLAIAVKVNAAVLLLLLPALYFVDQWPTLRQRRWRQPALRLAIAAPLATLAVVAVVLLSFYLHIAAATEIKPGRQYKASPAYLAHLQADTAWTPTGFAVGLADHWRYMKEYEAGVPRLDVCKPGENGSAARDWPLGGKTINYRWNKVSDNGLTKVDYTYLVGNPVVWWSVLLGVVLSSGLVIGHLVFAAPVRDNRQFAWIALFTSLYLGYMLAIAQIERVMYLYHYLLPLVFGVINLALVWNYLFGEQLRAGRRHAWINLGLFVGLAATVFCFFAPLTYGWPIGADAVELRQWLGLWKLEPVR